MEPNYPQPDNQTNNDEDQIHELEERNAYEEDYDELPPGDIVAYNELRSCADLYRMYENKQLEIQPEFQREIVWSNPSKTRFIDSLIKQLPIPSMCISLDYKTDKRIVIDGLQRIHTIVNFLGEESWRLSSLDDIDSRISGKTIANIKDRHLELYERVENLTIPVTVIRCDYSKESHNNYMFTIFHRLNTGGTKLNNQEIRNCIYGGTFNNFLKEMAWSESWKRLLDVKAGATYRFSNEELILRFIAFYSSFENYTGRLAKFLNDYMYSNKNLPEAEIANKRNFFNRVVDFVYYRLLEERTLVKTSKATTDGLLVGVGRNIDYLETLDPDHARELYRAFRSLPEYSVENLKEGLSGKERVIERLNAAVNIFSGR